MRKTTSESSEGKTNREKNSENRQINMGLRYSRLEFLYKLKRMARKVEKDYTMLPFWQNAYIWSAIISIFGIALISFLVIRKNFTSLPPKIPIIYDLENESWKNYPKMYIFSLPIVLIVTGLINLRILKRVYYMNKNLALMICVLITLISFLSLAALNEIILLTTR